MATGGPAKDLFDEVTCPICLDYFKDPVTVAGCGHNFCRACLSQSLGESVAEASCPQCKGTFEQRNLIPHRPLANVLKILIAKKLFLPGVMGRVCEKHQEPPKLFCKDHESLICLVCDKSKEHENQKMTPLEEISPEFKDQIWNSLETLWQKRQKMLAYKVDTEKESQGLLKQTKAEREKMVAEFRQLHQFLEEQEKLLLAQMEEVETEIAKKRDEHLARLSEELSSLESVIEEMEGKCQQPASELLQDIRSFLQRSQAKENVEDPPVAFPPDLKWRIWDFCDICPFLEGVMKQFRAMLISGLQLQKANVTLDPDTAFALLVLSEDRKSVRCGETPQDLPDNPQRFVSYPAVLGHEGFTAGRHFWDVVVGSEEELGMGVARNSVRRKGDGDLGPEEGVWDLGKWGGKYRASNYSNYPPLSLSEEPKRIRVTLNYEGGRVAFYDADRGALIFAYSAASFSRETLQPLFFVFNKGQLTLSAFASFEIPPKETPSCLQRREKTKVTLPEKATMAVSGGPVQDLCEEATCPICLEYFRDPVIIPECGHNFCRACLSQCWEKSEAEASCPQCRERVPHRNLIRNRPLANVVEILIAKKKLGLQEEKRVEGKGRICEKHQEPLKLFCKDHRTPICVVCDKSKEHENHKVIPLEEASQEYKNWISSCLDNLRKEREKILTFKADTEKESQNLLEQTDAERERMMAAFRRLRQFLEEQEKLLLAQMEEVAKEIARKRDEHLARLSKELSSLESSIQEMEDKHRKPASELLQDIGSFLQRALAKEKFQSPAAFPPDLKWKIWDFCDINPFLEGVMKPFRDTLGAGLKLQKENVTLDPDTAHPRLFLSEDHKSVRRADELQDLPDNPERFDSYNYVLGHEGFTAGRHFWDILVEGEEGWSLGVARKSVMRKGEITASPEEGMWCMGKWAGEYRACIPPDYLPLSLSEEPKRIRVALNCEGGRVAFYDADRADLLYTFQAASFSGETLRPFFWIYYNVHLTLPA
ncbi:uncharacterized protein LOC133378865 [Rhineura floridana]|uniref:uncharacterized protein LOC133378865 n=1 Tax=Rhineura floridana TaxID=261503 RepID=UPI002AC7EB83|nr:uncharacterized protein LOC133378865 [Rhineura floridana]